MMGGIIYAILMLFGIKYTSSSIVLYSFELPMSVLIIVSFLCFWFVKKVVKLLQYQLNVSNYLYSIKIEDGEHSAEGVGFYDTGNNVIIDGEGVNIISINLFMKLYKDNLFRNATQIYGYGFNDIISSIVYGIGLKVETDLKYVNGHLISKKVLSSNNSIKEYIDLNNIISNPNCTYDEISKIFKV